MPPYKSNTDEITIPNTQGDVFGVGVEGEGHIIIKNLYLNHDENHLYWKENPNSKCKSSIAVGQNTIFVGRSYEIKEIGDLLKSEDAIVSICGMGGLGKTSLALQTISKYSDLFDCIIDIYLDSGRISFSNFLLELAKRMNLPIPLLEKLSLEDRIRVIKNTLAEYKNGTLIFIDNFETVIESIDDPKQSMDAKQIIHFLERIPKSVKVLLTSRIKYNYPSGVRHIDLDGLNIDECKELFLRITHDIQIKNSKNIQERLENLVVKKNGHPLSLTILAKSYEGGGLEEIENMLSVDTSVEDTIQMDSRLKSVDASFNYSFNLLISTSKSLAESYTIYFVADMAAEIFTCKISDIDYLHKRSFLSVVKSDRYGDLEKQFWLYSFHPLIKEYLKKKGKGTDEENLYSKRICEAYYGFINDLYLNTINQDQAYFSKTRLFDIIMNFQENDIEQSIFMLENSQRYEALRIIGFLFFFRGSI